MPLYKITERLSDGIFGVCTTKYAHQTWVKVKLRKPVRCALTGIALEPGDLAIRPITNGSNRMARISLEEAEKRCPKETE